MTAGKVITGFSAPYIGVYANNSGTISYTKGRRLARGVDVSLDVQTSDDNEFYADNVLAESENGRFTGGTVKLTVDGLHDDAEQLIYGLPEPDTYTYGESKTAKVFNYGDNATPPYVGIGFVIAYESGGTESFQPMVLTKSKFATHGTEAKTRESKKNWQTQSLEAAIHRDDGANHNWKKLFEAQSTEAEAIAILESFLGVGKAD